MSVLVTLSEMKTHLKMSSDAADTYIQTLIDGCEEFAAQELGVSFSPENGKVEYVDGGGELLYCSTLPVRTITEVVDTYYDDIVEADRYRLDGRGRGVQRVIGEPLWETGSERFKVTYDGGYHTIDAVPVGIKLFVFGLVGKVWFNRDGRMSEGGSVSVNWGSVMDSDFRKIVEVHSLKRTF